MKRPNTYIGSPVERVEDIRFLKGRGQYIDDIRREGQWCAAFVRSSVAHGMLPEGRCLRGAGYARRSRCHHGSGF